MLLNLIKFVVSKNTMFFQRLKDISLKKIVKRKWAEIKQLTSSDLVKKVGIILDETCFQEKDALIRELVKKGIRPENIEILVFRDHISKKETFDYPVFSYRDFKWTGSFDSDVIQRFISQYYDLLINYYPSDKGILQFISQSSRSGFKAGFASVDKKLNDLMIATDTENHSQFTEELFKYLKILNKI
jgi:hypothetical protein